MLCIVLFLANDFNFILILKIKIILNQCIIVQNKELTNQIIDAKRDNEDLRMELASLQQKWTKDKNDLLHKARQEEKVSLITYIFQ